MVKFKIIFLYILTSAIWGCTWLAIRISLKDISLFYSVGIRFTIASAIIATIMYVKKVALPMDRTSVILYLVMGVFSFLIPFGLVYWGEQYVPSGLAAVLFGIYPFFVVIFSFFLLKNEKIGKYKLFGMISAFAGLIVIFSDQFGSDINSYLIGMFAIVLSGAMQAIIVVYIKRYGKNLNPLSMNLIPMLITGLSMLLAGFIYEDFDKLNFSSNAIIAVLFLAIFGSVVTFSSYYWLLKKINIILLSLMAFITPIIALAVGWVFYGEYLKTIHIAGSGLVLFGILFAISEGFKSEKLSLEKIKKD